MKKLYSLCIISAGVLWGIIGIFVREFSVAGFTSMEITTLRIIVTAVAMIIFLLLKDRRKLSIRIKDSWYFIGTGIFSILFFNYCYFKTINLVSLSVAAILLYTAPIMVMIMSVILFKEKITINKLASLLMTFLGCILVTGVGFSDGSNISLITILTGLASGFGYALYSIFGRYALKRYHPFTVTTYTFIFASFGAIGITDFTNIHKIINESNFILIEILLLGLITSIIPYVLYTIGLNHIESSKASIIASVEPVVATISGIIFFNETFSISNALGVLLVILAIILLIRQPKVL